MSSFVRIVRFSLTRPRIIRVGALGGRHEAASSLWGRAMELRRCCKCEYRVRCQGTEAYIVPCDEEYDFWRWRCSALVGDPEITQEHDGSREPVALTPAEEGRLLFWHWRLWRRSGYAEVGADRANVEFKRRVALDPLIGVALTEAVAGGSGLVRFGQTPTGDT